MNNNQQAFLWGDDTYVFKPKENYPSVCREAAIKYGSDHLALEQLIGLLLDCPKETAEELARMSIRGLINASDKELLTYKGVGSKGLLKIRGVFSLYKMAMEETRSEHPRITCPKDVADLLMSEMKYLEQEHFKVVLMNTKNEVIKIITTSIGSLNQTIVHPREIFKNAIKESADSIILVHNHPSGDITPSKPDKDTTKTLVDAGKIIGIKVRDHIIIGDGKFTSLKEMNLI